MIPTISDTEIRYDYMYEDDYEIRIIRGFDRALQYAHPSTRRVVGIKIKDKSVRSTKRRNKWQK